MTRTIAIRNWEKFQHYKDRDPPWIKFYRDILTAESWVLGTDSSRLVQVASMLLAARYQNATPLKFDLFRKVASLDISAATFNAAIAHLAQTDFLEVIEIQEVIEPSKHVDSTVLATCTSETEQSREETEKKQSQRERRARKCPESFVVTDELRAWAATQFPLVNVDVETAAFRDYTYRDPKGDWPATWRSWIRKARPTGNIRPTRYEQLIGQLHPESLTDPTEAGTFLQSTGT
jgi:hypothetical protein